MSPKRSKLAKTFNGVNLHHVMKSFNHKAGIPDEAVANTAEMEKELYENLRAILLAGNMPLAVKNLDALRAEKSGDKSRRNDGTVGWYHELIPIVMMIELARLGKKGGGFDLKDLDEHGGLEVLICTHLRHDSVEDHIRKEVLRKDLQRMVAEIRLENPNYDVDHAQIMVEKIVNKVDQMSQKRLFHPDGSKVIENGRHAKEDVKLYTLRMINDDKANPVVYMLKLCDIIVNSATMFGAGKFASPEKRKQKFNDYEDMFGQRYGFTDMARSKWPEFSAALHTLDCTMAFILYPHFRYMESVDLAYPNKTPMNIPVGIMRSLPGALRFENLAPGLNPVHIFLKRMQSSVDPAENPEKSERLQDFMKNVMAPTVSRYANKFPYLFQPAPPLPEASIPAPVVH